MSTTPPPNKVMISYNWGSQEFAKTICAKLTKEGYSVWMDILLGPDDGMKKDIISGMTDGLTKACCMVVILSPSYEESQNCRTELKGAYVRRIPIVYLKHPSHKVNAETLTVMGTSLYQEYDVDPTDGKTRVKNMPAFLNEIGQICPLGSPARPHQKTRILLVGNAGVGKSSIASLLINGTVVRGMNPDEIYVSPRPVPGTWQTTEHSNDNYIIVDTMGIGLEDPEVNPLGSEQAVKNLKDFLISSRQGYHYIFLVIKNSRNSFASQVQGYQVFYKTLFPDMFKHFVVIVTFTEDLLLSDETAASLYSQFTGIGVHLPVDLPTTNDLSYTPEITESLRLSKEKIENYLHKTNIKPKVPKCSMIERNKFYLYIRKVMQILGYQWNDQMETILLNMGLSEKSRNAFGMIQHS